MEYERSKPAEALDEGLKRSWIRPKKREKKTLWRTGQHKLDSGHGKAALRPLRNVRRNLRVREDPGESKALLRKEGLRETSQLRIRRTSSLEVRARTAAATRSRTRALLPAKCHDRKFDEIRLSMFGDRRLCGGVASARLGNRVLRGDRAIPVSSAETSLPISSKRR
jgi:hypothetical protein